MNKKKGQKDDKNDPKVKFMMELEEAKRHLVDGVPEESIKIAHRAMMEYKSVSFDPILIQFYQKKDETLMILLPAYFVLAEAYISDKNQTEKETRLKSAEDYLFGAYVAYTKYKDEMPGEQGESEVTEEEVNQLKATLDKTFAKLFLAQRYFNKALDYLTKGIYEDSRRYGPESVQVAMSYYTMGSIFQEKQNKPQEVQAFYEKTVDIWFKYLLRYLQVEFDLDLDTLDIDETLVKEAVGVIDNIRVYFNQVHYDDENQFEQTMNMINYTLGLLYKILGEKQESVEYLKLVAQKQAEYGDKNEVERIYNLIDLIEQ